MTEKLQSILEAQGLSALLGKFSEQGVTDSILGDLTDSDLKELGIDKLGERKRLLAVFGKSGGGGLAISVTEESAPQGVSSGAPSKTAATPAEATKDSPWVNTLGMPFVPIPRFETRFCIWPVRVQDYEAYCMASGAKFPEIPFPQESDHPIVGVTWNDAIEFCVWLTGKERAEGKIDDKTVYRLPTDLEWSSAVGLPHEPEPSPAERHLKAPGYPWGLRWPPPKNAGNYEHERDDQLAYYLASRYCARQVAEIERDNNEHGASAHSRNLLREAQEASKRLAAKHKSWRASWRAVDDFEFTSPVGAFGPNGHGLHDLGGNVWEWCIDSHAIHTPHLKTIRGGSFSCLPANQEDWLKPRGDYNFDVEYVPNETVYRSSFRSAIDGTKVGFKSFLRSNTYTNNDTEWAIEMLDNMDLISVTDLGFRIVVVPQ